MYKVNSECALHWVSWSDEYVVFDESSGQTHQLDPVRAFVLNFLGIGAYSFEAILAELATVPALTMTPRLSELLSSILNELSAHGLVTMATQ